MTYSTQAIVLKKISVGETDAVAVLYTRDFGKIRTYAQGVKKETAKLKGHIEALSLSAVQFVLGTAGERLTYAQMLQPWQTIRNDFNRMAIALYMVELVDRHCLIGEPDTLVWELLVSSLIELERCDSVAVHSLVEVFEHNILESLGYGGAKDMQALGAVLARPFMLVYNKVVVETN